MKKRSNIPLDPYAGSAVTFCDPAHAILRQGSRLTLGQPISLYCGPCVPVYTLKSDSLTNFVRLYASFFQTVKTQSGVELSCSFISLARLVLAARRNRRFACLLLASPISIVEG